MADTFLETIRRYRLRGDRVYLESACDAIMASGAPPPPPKPAPKRPTPKPSYLPPGLLDRLNPLPNGHRRDAAAIMQIMRDSGLEFADD